MSALDSLLPSLAEVQLRRELGDLSEAEVVPALLRVLEKTGLRCRLRLASGVLEQSTLAHEPHGSALEIILRGTNEAELGVLTLLDAAGLDAPAQRLLGRVVSHVVGWQDEATKAWKGLHQMNNALATVLANLELADALLLDEQRPADAQAGARPNGRRAMLPQAVRQALDATVGLVEMVQRNRAQRPPQRP